MSCSMLNNARYCRIARIAELRFAGFLRAVCPVSGAGDDGAFEIPLLACKMAEDMAAGSIDFCDADALWR